MRLEESEDRHFLIIVPHDLPYFWDLNFEFSDYGCKYVHWVLIELCHWLKNGERRGCLLKIYEWRVSIKRGTY